MQMALTELLRLSDGLANQSFCQLDISRVQLKYNWTVSKRLLTSGSKPVWKSRLLLKAQLIFFKWMVWKLYYFEWINLQRVSACHVALSELLRHSDGLANWSFSWSDIWRVQLKSNWTVGESLLASDQEAVRECRLILLKGQWMIFLKPNFKTYSSVKKNQWWSS